jgi:hypothetical protein
VIPFPATVPWADVDNIPKGLPSQTFKQYLSQVDAIVRALVASSGTGIATVKTLFRAHMSAHQAFSTSQTPVKVNLNVIDVDVPGGSYSIATQRWTPPAGTVHIQASAFSTVVTTGVIYGLRINKKGSANSNIIAQSTFFPAGTGIGCSVSVFDQANGTDFYEVYVASLTAGSIDLNEFPANTTWSGAQWPGP